MARSRSTGARLASSRQVDLIEATASFSAVLSWSSAARCASFELDRAGRSGRSASRSRSGRRCRRRRRGRRLEHWSSARACCALFGSRPGGDRGARRERGAEHVADAMGAQPFAVFLRPKRVADDILIGGRPGQRTDRAEPAMRSGLGRSRRLAAARRGLVVRAASARRCAAAARGGAAARPRYPGGCPAAGAEPWCRLRWWLHGLAGAAGRCRWRRRWPRRAAAAAAAVARRPALDAIARRGWCARRLAWRPPPTVRRAATVNAVEHLQDQRPRLGGLRHGGRGHQRPTISIVPRRMMALRAVVGRPCGDLPEQYNGGRPTPGSIRGQSVYKSGAE